MRAQIVSERTVKDKASKLPQKGPEIPYRAHGAAGHDARSSQKNAFTIRHVLRELAKAPLLYQRTAVDQQTNEKHKGHNGESPK